MEKKESLNYLPIVQAIEQLVQRAGSLKIKKENPNGDTTSHKISGIRIAYLEKESFAITYANGIMTPMQKNESAPELLLTLFFANEKKEASVSIPMQERILAQPEGLLSLGWTKITLAIDELIDDFYASKIKDNKFHQEAHGNVVYLEDSVFEVSALEPIPSSLCDQMLHVVRDCYLAKHVAFVDANLTAKRELWIVVDSWGTRVIDHRDRVEFGITPYFMNGQRRVYQSQLSGMFKDCDALRNYLSNELLPRLQEELFTLDRKQLESGIYPILLAPSAVGTLFHEAIAGHMLSGAYIADGISTVFKGKLGKRVAKEGFMQVLKHIQIWDCPRDEDMLASYQYDMEGTEARNVCLIDKGKVEGYLLDRNSAFRLKLENNGHALAGSFNEQLFADYFLLPEAVLPEPRVSNLEILVDSDYSLEKMKADFFRKFGYYLWVESSSGEVNVETGTFELKVDVVVKVYPNGKKEYFHGGVLSANLTDFLSAIRAASNHYGKNQGYCGAPSGVVPTEEVAPAMGMYGVNWVPYSLPGKNTILTLKRDKYVPKDWEQKTSSFEMWLKRWDLECCRIFVTLHFLFERGDLQSDFFVFL